VANLSWLKEQRGLPGDGHGICQSWPSPAVALAGALPELDFACGLGTLALLHGDVVPDAHSLRPVGGYLPVPRTPPAPDPALLNTHELTDPRQVTWWRERLRRVYSG
jgi:O-succinylbenzoate synthase